MRLTLTYRGPLHAQTRKDGRIEEKHSIREKFHKQIRELWTTHPALADIFKNEAWQLLGDTYKAQLNNPNRMMQAFDIEPFRFVPLITRGNWLSCDLDILFLRKEPPGAIVDSESGDIDNRIKVLFDALRIPHNKSELPALAKSDSDEQPFFCLLEDDSLITGFRLDSERLLFADSASEAEVQLTVRVTIRAIRLTYSNLGLAD